MTIINDEQAIINELNNFMWLRDRGLIPKLELDKFEEDCHILYLHSSWEKMLRKYADFPAKVWHFEPINTWIRRGYPSDQWLIYGLFETGLEVWEFVEEQTRQMLIHVRPTITQPIVREKKCKHLSLSMRYQIMKRDHFHCQLCGKGVDDGAKLEIDHKLPKSLGGTFTHENLWTLCFDCNRGKSNRDRND